MVSHWLLDRLELFNERPALIWRGRPYSFESLRQQAIGWQQRLKDAELAPGTILGIVGDYSPNVCALLIAAIVNRNIVVPLTTASSGQHDEFLRVAEAAVVIHLDDDDTARFVQLANNATHPLLREMSARRDAGLILFSSGSTGPSKATLLDFERLLARFAQVRTATRTLVFLQLDHIGGINTLFHGLCNGGTIVTTAGRSVDAVCSAIDEHGSSCCRPRQHFLRMMLIADAVSPLQPAIASHRHLRHRADAGNDACCRAAGDAVAAPQTNLRAVRTRHPADAIGEFGLHLAEARQ